jgi:hypothetical protein
MNHRLTLLVVPIRALILQVALFAFCTQALATPKDEQSQIDPGIRAACRSIFADSGDSRLLQMVAQLATGFQQIRLVEEAGRQTMEDIQRLNQERHFKILELAEMQFSLGLYDQVKETIAPLLKEVEPLDNASNADSGRAQNIDLYVAMRTHHLMARVTVSKGQEYGLEGEIYSAYRALALYRYRRLDEYYRGIGRLEREPAYYIQSLGVFINEISSLLFPDGVLKP